MTSARPADGPLVDAHLHIWSDDAASYPWRPVNGATVPEVPGSVELVLDALARHRVGIAVTVQTRAYGPDHSYLADAVGRFPDRILAVAAPDPVDPWAPAELARLHEQGFRGLRLDPLGSPGSWLVDGTVLPIWDAATEHEWPIELLIGPDQLPAVGHLGARRPETPAIVEHMARFGARHDTPLETLLALSGLPNVLVKVSALASISAAPPPHEDIWPLILAVVDGFGPERLMWGSDMPWIGAAAYGEELATISALPFLDEAGGAWLLGGTARATFRIGAATPAAA